MARKQGKRNEVIKPLVENGQVRTILDFFDYFPPTPVVEHIGTNHNRFLKIIHKVQLFRIEELFILGRYFGLDERTVFELLLNQYLDDKAKRKRPSPKTGNSK